MSSSSAEGEEDFQTPAPAARACTSASSVTPRKRTRDSESPKEQPLSKGPRGQSKSPEKEEDEENKSMDVEHAEQKNKSPDSVFGQDTEEGEWINPQKKRRRNKKAKAESPKRLPPRRKLHFELPPPAFLQHPVVLQDLGTGTIRYRNLGPIVHKFWASTVGDIQSQRPLGPDRFLIGCKSLKQQQKLAATKNLAGVHVHCTIPDVKTVGVVYGIPPTTCAESLLPHIKQAKTTSRLNRANGSASWAVKIVFSTAILPKTVTIGKQEFVVRPYKAPVLNCSNCAKLGHTHHNCPSKTPTCRYCGRRGHRASTCKAEKPFCINCRGDHSAAYQGCPEMAIRERANEVRSENYLVYSECIRRAKKQIADEKESAKQTKQTMQTLEHDPFWRSETVISPTDTKHAPKSYARAVKASLPQAESKAPLKKAALKQSTTSKPNPPKNKTKFTKTQTKTSTPQKKKKVQLLREKSRQVLIRRNLERKRIESIEKNIIEKLSNQLSKQIEEMTTKINEDITTKVNEEVKKRLLKEEERQQIKTTLKSEGCSKRENFVACTLLALSKARESGDPNELIKTLKNAFPERSETKQTPPRREKDGSLMLLAKHASDTPLSQAEWNTLKSNFGIPTKEGD